MAKEKLLFDKTELVCGQVMGRASFVVNVKYNDIIHISFLKTEEKGLFKTVPSERIEIKLKSGQIVFYNKKDEEKFWDKYKAGLVKFAHDNRLTLEDHTQD